MLIVRNILLGFSLAAPIGPVNVEIIKAGLKKGFLPAILVGLGAMTADTTYLLLTYFGFTYFLVVPVIHTIISIAGTLILGYLGIMSIKESFSDFPLAAQHLPLDHYYKTGFLIAITSPMTIVWWVGVFGTLVATSTRAVSLINCFAIILGAAIWGTSLSVLLHWGKKFVNERTMKAVSFCAGCALLGFALYCGYMLVR
jgi:threonine/homoserine/homoserine lactone efflux protein